MVHERSGSSLLSRLGWLEKDGKKQQAYAQGRGGRVRDREGGGPGKGFLEKSHRVSRLACWVVLAFRPCLGSLEGTEDRVEEGGAPAKHSCS